MLTLTGAGEKIGIESGVLTAAPFAAEYTNERRKQGTHTLTWEHTHVSVGITHVYTSYKRRERNTPTLPRSGSATEKAVLIAAIICVFLAPHNPHIYGIHARAHTGRFSNQHGYILTLCVWCVIVIVLFLLWHGVRNWCKCSRYTYRLYRRRFFLFHFSLYARIRVCIYKSILRIYYYLCVCAYSSSLITA